MSRWGHKIDQSSSDKVVKPVYGKDRYKKADENMLFSEVLIEQQINREKKEKQEVSEKLSIGSRSYQLLVENIHQSLIRTN